MNSSNPEFGRKRIGFGMYLACWLTRRDPELLAEARTVFRFQVASEAILLLAVAGIALITWAAFFAQFLSAYIVVPLTILAVSWLIIMDQTLAAAGWEPKGVLRENKKGFKFSTVFFIRLAIGLITSFATSYSAMMVLNSKSIDVQIEKDVNERNSVKRAEADGQKARIRETRLGSVQADVQRAIGDLNTINAELSRVHQQRDNAAAELAKHKLKENCEMHGGRGCLRGNGPEARAARILMARWTEEKLRAEADIRALEDRRAAAERAVNDATGARDIRERDVQTAEAEIDQRVNAETEHPRKDPILSYRAMDDIFKDKDKGPATYYYWQLILALLLAVELSYVLCSQYLAHANIHDSWLAADTIAEHLRASARLLQVKRDLYSDSGHRTAVRVVSRWGESV